MLAVLGTPGPTNTLLLASGAAVGFRRSVVLVPAELVGYLAAILTIGLLVGPIVWDTRWLSNALRLAIAVYLVIVAIRLWRTGDLEVGGRRPVSFEDVFVTTLLNPKASIFALGIIPMRDPNLLAYIAAFCALLFLVSACWIGVGAALCGGLLPTGRLSLVPRISAAVIAAFAMLLVWTVLATGSGG